MNKLFWYLRGFWIVEITGATPGWILNRLTRKRIPFWGVTWLDDFTLRLSVFPRDLPAVRQAADAAMCDMRDASMMGAKQALRGVFHRPVLIVMLVLAVLTVVVTPQFLLFYEVSGNETVPDELILRTLEDLGVGFGMHGPKIRPKWIKDHVLNRLPQLQWITVTQNGCMARVVVRERPETPQTLERRGFANVIATRTGLITEQSILAGQAVKKPGDLVLAGEMLVSGLVDLEQRYTLEYAQAEIFARTWRTKVAATPEIYGEKVQSGEPETCIWLEFGKHRIKIFGNSGILTADCDKMSNRKNLSLPGGLQLPVAVLTETYVPYTLRDAFLEEQAAEDRLMDYVERTTLADMQAGEIRGRSGSLELGNGVYRLKSVLECHEMIAETVEAKWNEEDFNDDGTHGQRGTVGADH